MSTPDALVATIALFDGFDIALSSAEVWMYCAAYQEKSYSLSQVEGLLSADNRLECTNGLWTLAGRTDLARIRVVRGFPVHERWAIAGRAACLAALVPFLQLFAVCNTFGYGVAKEDSDIDVFVVALHRRLWTVRFLLTVMLHVLRLRRHGSRIAKRICLSFFVATDSLCMAPLSLFLEPIPLFPDPSGGATQEAPDPYLAWWVGSVIPLVDRGAYADFITANRPFIERYRKEFTPRLPPPSVIASPAKSLSERSPEGRQSNAHDVIPSRAEGSRLASITEYFLSGRLGDGVESLLCFIQLRKIARSSIGKHRENPTSVVVSDHVLKFHENDRRAAIRDQWIERLAELGIAFGNLKS